MTRIIFKFPQKLFVLPQQKWLDFQPKISKQCIFFSKKTNIPNGNQKILQLEAQFNLNCSNPDCIQYMLHVSAQMHPDRGAYMLMVM